MREKIYRTVLLVFSGAALLPAQTEVDLRFQSKNVDFSAAASTKPLKMGTAIPATCSTGEMFFLSSAPAGSNVYGCTAFNVWTLESGGSGGNGGNGGTGATTASQLGDFLVTQTSGTTLSIGTSCSVSTPCNVRFGSQTFSFESPATVTVSSGSGTAYIYISSTGVLTVGHNLTANCSSTCVAQSGVTGFPLNSVPLFIWTAVNGGWSSQGIDERAFLSASLLGSGAGIQVTQTAGQSTVAADQTVVGLRVAAPATSSSSCVAGSWATDGVYYYLCVNTNQWMRAALSSF